MSDELITLIENRVKANQAAKLPFMYGENGYYEKLKKLRPKVQPIVELAHSPIFQMDSPELGPTEMDIFNNFSLDSPITREKQKRRPKSDRKSSFSAASPLSSSFTSVKSLVIPSRSGNLIDKEKFSPTVKSLKFPEESFESNPKSPWKQSKVVNSQDLHEQINESSFQSLKCSPSLGKMPKLSQRQRKMQKVQVISAESVPKVPWKSPSSLNCKPVSNLLDIQKEQILDPPTPTSKLDSDWKISPSAKISFLSIQLEQERTKPVAPIPIKQK